MISSLFVGQHHIWVCHLPMCMSVYICYFFLIATHIVVSYSLLAPEILSGQPYNVSVDWWSLGIVMYLLSVGKV